MNYGVVIFLGALLALVASWYGLVVGPFLQFGTKQQVLVEATGSHYPSARSGLAQRGLEVYRANGCNYCHSQQVRPPGLGSDFERDWGIRPSVAQDYIMDRVVMVGNQRIGQDLANIGARQTNEVWHFLHLYEPKSVAPGSMMPPFRYLFEKRKINGQGSPDALPLGEEAGVEKGYEIVPSYEARALVAYLLSLESQTVLYETPLPEKPESEGDTNQPPAEPLIDPAAPVIPAQ